jgi:hypothetical protein
LKKFEAFPTSSGAARSRKCLVFFCEMLRFLYKIEKPRRRKCFKKFQGNSLPFFEYFRLNSTVWCPRRGAGDRDPNAVYGAAEIGHNQYFFRTYFCVCASVPELERRCAKSFILKLVYPCISFSRRVRVRAVFHLPIEVLLRTL